jgi:transaldolase/glucose-6-phosphate isomerase
MSDNNAIHRAYELGQSFWLDNIRRDLVEDGELASLIDSGEIRGITSNPSIFEQAIGKSDLYLAAMRPMAHAGWGAEAIFETLAIEDIRAATDLFLPLYEGTDGKDGFVSIEVNPELAADMQKTLEEARRLWETVNRPNLMVKIPATKEGIPAIEQAIFEGININVTLIFSLDRYSEVMQAYIEGLERRAAEGKPLERIASVASFFVSRVDTAVDQRLEAIIHQEGPHAERAHALLGKAAIANAKMAYAQFKSVFDGSRFTQLGETGARLQRPLWASTSTKNPTYRDVMYVDELIGPNTVNTLPPKTLDAFRDHGKAEDKLEAGLSDARAQLEALEALDISLDEVTEDLERDGVRAFADAYGSLIDTVSERATGMESELGALSPAVIQHLEHLDGERIAPRFWRVDPDLWPGTKGGSVIKLRLEWLDDEMESHLGALYRLVRRIDAAKIDCIGWIGGGYMLEAVAEAAGGERKAVLLNTLDPQEARSFARKTPVESTFFVVESRTLTDLATMAKLAGVWSRARNRMGEAATTHFVVVAPPGSQLAEWAQERNIEHLIEWNLSSGAPVSEAGLLLAALLGADPGEVVASANDMKELCSPGAAAARNPGLYLGAVLAAGSPIYLLADPAIEDRVEWLANYARARAGLPIQLGFPQVQPATLIYLRLDGEIEQHVNDLTAEGAPAAILQTEPGLGGVGSEAVRWEVGVGVAAHLLQDPTYAEATMLPAVERLLKMLVRYQKKSDFGIPRPDWDVDFASVWWSGRGYGRDEPDDIGQVAISVLERLEPGGSLFIGLYQAHNRSWLNAVSNLQASLAEKQRTQLAFVLGGLPEAKLSNGFLLLIGCISEADQTVPDLGVSYGELQLASMIADLEQNKEAGNTACGIHFKSSESSTAFMNELAEQASRLPASAA